MNDVTEREQLITLCTRLGAPTPVAAAVMADQLRKRCDQLVAQRGLGRVEAMEHLLRLVTQGSRGEAPAGFEGVRPPEAPETR